MRLGSVVLAGMLLGVPRALDSRAFGAQRSVYLEVSPQAPELAAFALALERALAGASWTLATRRSRATLVVDLLTVATGTDARGRPVEAISLAVRDPLGLRRLVLHGTPAGRTGTAQQLVMRLSPHES
jgi:hypothetical protein